MENNEGFCKNKIILCGPQQQDSRIQDRVGQDKTRQDKIEQDKIEENRKHKKLPVNKMHKINRKKYFK